MKRILLFLFIVSALEFICCKGKEGEGIVGKDAKARNILKLKLVKVMDREGIGSEAFSVLVPTNWNFDGGIYWTLRSPAMPAVVSFKVWNPSDSEVFEVFPAHLFSWSNDQMFLSTFPIGSNYLGSEVRPPMGAVEFLKAYLVPKFRGKYGEIKFLEERPLDLPPETPSYQQGVELSRNAGRMRIEYLEEGREVEEEIYGIIERYRFSMPGIYGMIVHTNWVADYLFSFKTLRGELEGKRKIFQLIAHSFKLNPTWFSKYNQVVNFLVQNQIQQISNIGEISRIIARTSDEISDMVMSSYKYRESVMDKIATQWSDAMRGIDRYQNPIDGREMELPSGYYNAWVNTLGEYILSDDPNFDPNIGSNVRWEKMEKK